jgi:hypothetical protein
MSNEVGMSLFAKAGELGAPVEIMVMTIKKCIPVLDVCVVTIGLWDFDNKNNVASQREEGLTFQTKVTYCYILSGCAI